MDISLRPVPHGCYVPVAVDAISFTWRPYGFTPMQAVLGSHHVLLDDVPVACYEPGEQWTPVRSGSAPALIACPRTQSWSQVPDAALRILRAADDGLCASLCMTHFSFILGRRFPELAFAQCMTCLEFARGSMALHTVIVDVDERFYAEAVVVHDASKRMLAAGGRDLAQLLAELEPPRLVWSLRELKVLVGSSEWQQGFKGVGRACGVYSVLDRRSGQTYLGSGPLAFELGYFTSTGHGGKVPLIRLWEDAPLGDDDLEFAVLEGMRENTSRASVAARERHWLSVFGPSAIRLGMSLDCN